MTSNTTSITFFIYEMSVENLIRRWTTFIKLDSTMKGWDNFKSLNWRREDKPTLILSPSKALMSHPKSNDLYPIQIKDHLEPWTTHSKSPIFFSQFQEVWWIIFPNLHNSQISSNQTGNIFAPAEEEGRYLLTHLSTLWVLVFLQGALKLRMWFL